MAIGILYAVTARQPLVDCRDQQSLVGKSTQHKRSGANGKIGRNDAPIRRRQTTRNAGANPEVHQFAATQTLDWSHHTDVLVASTTGGCE